MNSFLLTLAAIILFVVGALFVAPNYVQWSQYKHIFEDQASSVLGKKVEVLGDVKLKLLPAPYLEFTKVKVHNSLLKQPSLKSNNLEDSLLSEIEAFKLWLAIPPLLQGNIKVTKLELDEPTLNLSFGKNGKAGWDDNEKLLSPSYIPGNISFDAINIINGRVNLQRTGQQAFKLEAVNGQFSATSLQGPFRFTGNFKNLGDVQNINLATSKQDQSGNMRLKSLVEVPKTGSRYLVDGELQALDNIPAFKGTLTGQAPIHLLALLHEAKEGQRSSAKSTSEDIIDIRSTVYANLSRIELQELSISVADNKRPQNINGRLILAWGKGIDLNTKLKANWVDLDKMLVMNENAGSFSQGQKNSPKAVNMAFGLLQSVLQNTGQLVNTADVQIEIVESLLGKSELSNFNLQLTKTDENYLVDKLSVDLPGRNRFELSGRLLNNGKDVSFEGLARAKGFSLGALSHWALVEKSDKNLFKNNPYFLRGGVKFSPGQFEISRLQGDLNGARISGRFKYDFADKKEFILELDSDEVNLVDISDKHTTLASLLNSLSASEAKTDNVRKGRDKKKNMFQSFTQQLEETEGSIKLRVGKLGLPNLKARDILVDGHLSQGHFKLTSFKVIGDGGLNISGKGVIRDIGNDSNGRLDFVVSAQDPQGLKQLVQQLELSEDITNNTRLLKDLSPLSLAITMNMHSGGLPSTEFSIAGDVANSQLTLNARHEGVVSTLGKKQVDITGTLINSTSQELISQLIRSNSVKSLNEQGQGIFSVQASGIPEQGIQARLRLDAGTTQARFNGLLQIKSEGSSGQGEVSVRSSNAAAGLSLIGLSENIDFVNEPMQLSARLEKKQDVYNIQNIKGKIGRNVVSGAGQFDFSDGQTSVKLDGKMSEGSLTTILSPLLPSALPGDINQVIAATGIQTKNAWSNQPFDTSKLKTLSGYINFDFGKLNISKKVALRQARLAIELKKDSIRVRRLNGQLYNGQFKANADLKSNGGPVALKASFSLNGADLADIFKSDRGTALARGIGSASLSFSGQGLSPLGLVAELKGQGKVRVSEGEIFDFSPRAIPSMIGQSNAKEKNEVLQSKFLKLLKGDTFSIRNASAPILLKDGVLEVKPVSLLSTPGRARTTTLLELASMKLDSEWQLDAVNRKNKVLPGVKMIFSGPLEKMTSLSPQIDISSLKQSLLVNKIEQDFDTLNKLNERDPETIRRLRKQNLPETSKRDNGQRLPTTINRDQQQLGNRKPANDNNSELPALTNLGTIDNNNPNSGNNNVNNQDLGVKYYYDEQGNLREQAIGENVKEEKPKKKEKKAESFFDRIFKEALGR